MILNIFSIYDKKAFAFISPFILPTPEMAIRTFSEAANDPAHMFCKHPLDFTLHHIGEFDDLNGGLAMFPIILNLGMANQFKQKGE